MDIKDLLAIADVPVVILFIWFVLQQAKLNREAAAQHHSNWRTFIAEQNAQRDASTSATLSMLSGSIDKMAGRLDAQLSFFAKRDEELVDLIREIRSGPAARERART